MKWKIPTLILIALAVQSCLCFCGPSKLVDANFAFSGSSKITSWNYNEELPINEIAFNINLDDSLSVAQNNNRFLFNKVQIAGTMQPCECFSDISPEWHMTKIEAITLYDLNENYLAGSDVADLFISKIFYNGTNSYRDMNLHDLTLSTHNLKFETSSKSFSAFLNLKFLLKEIPQKGLQQIKLKFTFRNGKVINALSPEFNIEA